jgi:hypothetical protein
MFQTLEIANRIFKHLQAFLAQRHLAQRHLAQRHSAQRHLAQRHLAQKHLATRHLAQRDLVASLKVDKSFFILNGSVGQMIFDQKLWNGISFFCS